MLLVESATQEERTKVVELLDQDVTTCFTGVHSSFTTFINVAIDTFIGNDMNEGVAFKVTFEEEVPCKDARVRFVSVWLFVDHLLSIDSFQ